MVGGCGPRIGDKAFVANDGSSSSGTAGVVYSKFSREMGEELKSRVLENDFFRRNVGGAGFKEVSVVVRRRGVPVSRHLLGRTLRPRDLGGRLEPR